MPKVVDHEYRKVKIAEATWEVIIEEGLEHATVRKIAKKAGLSVGSLRNTFPSQSDLILYSMKLVSERVKKRIASKRYTGSPLDVALELISEFLPTDDERKKEMEVWFVFSAKALTEPKLNEMFRQVHFEMSAAIRMLLLKFKSTGHLKENVDIDAETSRLHALVDGLGIHSLLHSKKLTNEEMLSVLKLHLETIIEQ